MMMMQHSLGNNKLALGGTAQKAAVPKPSRIVTNATPKQSGRWKAIDAGVDQSDDQQDIQRARGMTDSLFQGFGGAAGTNNPILSSHDYISAARTSFNNIEDGYYISPAFLDKMTVHVAKNFMDLPKVKVPLILGIWGGKGQGKTFQCALAYKKLGIAPIVMSAGELESGNAGEPAKLLRQRYREASDVVKKGKMCSLFINDLDAGAGRMGEGTQYTVNNQMVNATLMNIADNPTNVQLPGMYNQDEIPRVPIIATGNDFSTLYAPLIRDGRMEKYYWNPTREDRIGVCMGIFMDDDVNRADVEQLVDNFPGQSIDFFGALRSRVYDEMVRNFIAEVGLENMGKRLVNSREGKVTFDKPSMTLPILMEFGKMVVAEQENVKRVQLADAYLGGAELAGASGTSMPEAIGAAAAPDYSRNGDSTNGRRELEVSPAVQDAMRQQQEVRMLPELIFTLVWIVLTPQELVLTLVELAHALQGA
ncbi:Rubisco activase [Dunaliella salina]|uniref:Ribulose bisphosphate carboxylase/oxygenase activase, chloroplastic n=1 Tax=Dunaliella salina TaxID=3046 RepID=A0ABQ7GGV3_DUNSA|nr:Rubisco activase [Dunaliella salina]|eukprot:KAF5833834.1 Rubisco activase [Dunaliella salina]